MKHPSISIITATLNPDLKVFKYVLESIKNQDYPGKIDHIVLDGGSINGAVDFAKKYNCRVLVIPSSKDEGGNRFYNGLKIAKGDLVLILESDNVLTSKDWMLRMVEPFEDKRVFCTFPMHNSYKKEMNLLTRYTALIGAHEPTLYYLKKTDKVPLYFDSYDKGEILSEEKNYFVVKFSPDNFIVSGDNGYMVRKDVIKHVVAKDKSFIHPDAFAELLNKGFDTYGVVKNSIIHVMVNPNILDFVKRRLEVKQNFYDTYRGKRNYLVFNWQSKRDLRNLFLYMCYTFTLVEPVYISIRGYLRIRDIAWFLHPVMCFLMVSGYGWSELKLQLRRAV